MILLSLLLVLAQAPTTPTPPELRIEAPPEMAAAKLRMESIDRVRLGDVVRLVGLNDPGPPIRVELASSSSSRARSVAPWIAGFARQDSVVIFPSRSPNYPDRSLDDVLRHELAHALIWRATLGHPIPRWFNEGLAMAAERPGIRDQTQLFFDLASGSTPSLQEIDRLFDSGQADQSRAYQLSRVLVWDLLRKHGQASGGRILGLVGQGIPFETAFKDVTGQTTASTEAEFFRRQRVWTTWIPILFSQETLWMGITLLAILAIWRMRRRGAEMRKRWEEEEDGEL